MKPEALIFKEKAMPIFRKVKKKIVDEGAVYSSFHEFSITVIPKSGKEIIRKLIQYPL